MAKKKSKKKGPSRKAKKLAKLDRLLNALELSDVFYKLPFLKEGIFEKRSHVPICVRTKGSFPSKDLEERVRRSVDRRIRKVNFTIPAVSGEVRLNWYLESAFHLTLQLDNMFEEKHESRMKEVPGDKARALRELWAAFNIEVYDRALEMLGDNSQLEVIHEDDITKWWLGCSISLEGTFDHPTVFVNIECRLASQYRVMHNGSNRVAFSLPNITHLVNESKEIEWAPAIFNGASEKPVKVVIQRHALQRIRERLCVNSDSWELHVHLCIVKSVRAPTFSPPSRGDFMIEFRLPGSGGKWVKVGYFVGYFVGEFALISTFLFITNQGTPESKRLKEVLNLGRREIEYTNLDTLSAFQDSDLLDDEELTGLFLKAGLEHLLELDDLDLKGRGNGLNITKDLKKIIFPERISISSLTSVER